MAHPSVRWPDGNVGVLVGPASSDGLLILDFDSLDLVAEAGLKGLLPETAWQLTGKGEHFFYYYHGRKPATVVIDSVDNHSRLLDVKLTGQCVIAPSLDVSGKRYCYQDRPIVEISEEQLFEILALSWEFAGHQGCSGTRQRARRGVHVLNRSQGTSYETLPSALSLVNVPR